jgi:pyruvate/2-oxoglutarate dehydrogenase complex dihydrolipoamide acyltransferase (E2) component
MYRRSRTSGRARKIFLGVAATALLGGALAVGTGLGNAGENCAGLDTALRNNLNFIAGQRANPDVQSDARIANREAVVDLIQQRRATAGCTADVRADVPAPPAAAEPTGAPPAGAPPAAAPPAAKPPAAKPPADSGGGAEPAGNVVCMGSTVTLFNEDAAPAASSGTFPIGTTLKVTNLDNNKSITVKVTSPSGSCVLLNSAAYEQVREPGKFVIRRPVVERIG